MNSSSVPLVRQSRHAATASPTMLAKLSPNQVPVMCERVSQDELKYGTAASERQEQFTNHELKYSTSVSERKVVTPTASPMASPMNQNRGRAVTFMPPERWIQADAGEISTQSRVDQPGSTWSHLGPIAGFEEYSQTTSATVTPEPRSAGAMSMPLSGFRAAGTPTNVTSAAATPARLVSQSGTSVTFSATPTSTVTPTRGSSQVFETPTQSVPVAKMAWKRSSTETQAAAGATAVKSMSLAEAAAGATAVKSMSLAEAAAGANAVRSINLAEAAAGNAPAVTYSVDDFGARGAGLTTMPAADFRREAAAFRREAVFGATSSATNSMTLAGAVAGAAAADQQGGVATMPATAFRQPLRIPKAQSAELDAIAFGAVRTDPIEPAAHHSNVHGGLHRHKTVQLGGRITVELKVKVVAPGGGTGMNAGVYQKLGHRQDISLEILGQSRMPYDRYTEAWGPPSGGPPPNLESFALDLLSQGALERCDCLVVGSRGGQVCLPTFWRMKGAEVPPAVVINGGCAMGLPISVPWPDSAVTFIMIGGQDYFRQQLSLDQYLDDARNRVPPNNSTTAIMLVSEMAHMPQSQLLDAVLHPMIKAVTRWKEDDEDIPTEEFEKIVAAVTAFGFHGTLIHKTGIGDAWNVIRIPTDSLQTNGTGRRRASVPIYCD